MSGKLLQVHGSLSINFVRSLVNYMFIFTVCCWESLQKYVLHFDGAGRSILVLILMIIFVNINNKSFWNGILKTPVVIWLLWDVYAFANSVYQGYYENQYSLLLTKLLIPLFVLIAINSNKYANRSAIFNIIIIGLTINLLLTVINIPDLYEFQANRVYTASRVNQNEFGIAAIALFIVVFLKYKYGELRREILFILLIVPLVCIFLSGSRNAFLGLIVFLITIFLFTDLHYKLKMVRLLIGVPILILFIYFTLNNTIIGERIAKTNEQAQEVNLNSGTIFDKMGDRGIFYILGFKVFLAYPIFGIGLDNFPKFSGYSVQHSEYMIQLCELGIIGSLLFILFYLQIARRLFSMRSADTNRSALTLRYLHISILFIILIMALFIMVFSSIYFFLLLGILIDFSRDKNLDSLSDNEIFFEKAGILNSDHI
jgi:O-antigen ligase